jgi:hypothetical protein
MELVVFARFYARPGNEGAVERGAGLSRDRRLPGDS